MGSGVVLVVIGAILEFAVSVTARGFSIHTVGIIPLTGNRVTVDVNRSRPHALVRLDIRVAARPENVSAVRRAIETLDLPETLIDDAKLLVSELVTNSIRHAGLGPGEYIQITVTSSGRLLRVIVQDRTRDLAPSSVVGAIRPSPGAESGWGLYLVDRIASRWGTSFGRRAGYWFELNPGPWPVWASP